MFAVRIHLLFVLATLLPQMASAVSCGGSGIYCVSTASSLDVGAFGICSHVANAHASGKTIMVAAGSSPEWSSFRSNPPAGVTLSACGTGALIAWWKFDEASYSGVANEAVDSIGGRHGQAVGGATTSATAKFGRSATLTRQADPTTGQWVKVPYNALFDFGTTNFSYGTWVKLDGTNASASIMGNLSSGTGTGFSLELSSSNQARAKINVNATSLTAGSTINIDDNQWHHVLATVNRAGNLILYVDGVAAATTSISAQSAFSIDTSSNDLLLGARMSVSAPNPVNGLLDDTAVWNRVLTAAEVLAVFNSQPY